MLSAKVKLTDPSSARLLRKIRRRKAWWEPRKTLQQLGRDCRTFWRDMSVVSFKSRLAALPLTLCFFVVLIGQFPVVKLDSAKFPVLSMQGWTTPTAVQPSLIKTYATRQGQTKFKNLMETAWRLPYEDSLSLVAEINEEGYAEIGDVLEYPKSQELFDAVDHALRNSQFVASDTRSRSRVIFSFQKIDVWDKDQYPRTLVQ